MSPKKLLRFLLSTILAASMAAPVLAQDQPAAPPAPPAAAEAPPAAPEIPVGFDGAPLADGDKLVSIDGREYTVAEIRLLAGYRAIREPRINPEKDVPRLTGEMLEKLARNIGSVTRMAKLAEGAQLTLTEQEEKAASGAGRRIADGMLYKSVVTDKETPVSDEDAKAYYEANKEKLYKQEEELRMRHIFISTYVDYLVKEGDTLESIAKETGGDVAVADLILSDATKRPRVEAFDKAAEGGEADPKPLPVRALALGEKLKVPVRGDKEQAARAKVDGATERLRKGDSFEIVAQEVSENEQPGQLWTIRPATQERPILKELTDAFMGIGDGKFSEPLRTRHGFQVVFREGYTAAGYKPFEEVAGSAKTAAAGEKRQAVVADFFIQKLNDAAIATLDHAKWTAPAEQRKDEDLILTIDETKFTRADLNSALAAGTPLPEGADQAAFVKELATKPAVQGPLVEAVLKASGFLEDANVKSATAIVRENLLANKYGQKVADEKTATIPEADVQKNYDENKAQFEQKETYELHTAQKVADTVLEPEAGKAKATADLTAELERVTTLVEFRALATKINPADPRILAGGSLGTMEAQSLTPLDAEVIRATAVPGKSAVIYRDGKAVAYYVESKIAAGTKPLADVRAQIEETLRAKMKREIAEGLADDMRSEVVVKSLRQ